MRGALAHARPSWRTVKTILDNGLESEPIAESPQTLTDRVGLLYLSATVACMLNFLASPRETRFRYRRAL